MTERTSSCQANIVLLAAGHGSRFQKEGYVTPKPLLMVKQTPLACMALRSVTQGETPTDFNLVAVIQREHAVNYNFDHQIIRAFPSIRVVQLSHVLPGPVHTSLEATTVLDLQSPVVFVDCDQFFVQPGLIQQFLDNFNNGAEVVVATTPASGPDFGYVITTSSSRIIKVAEKVEISGIALAGVYGFATSQSFLSLAKSAIQKLTDREVCFSDLMSATATCGGGVSAVNIDNHFPCGTPLQYQQSLVRYSEFVANKDMWH